MRLLTALLCAAGLGAGIPAMAGDRADQANGAVKDNSTQRIVNPERTPTTDIEETQDGPVSRNRQNPAGNATDRETGDTARPGSKR